MFLQDLKIETWPIERLVPYARNARLHSEAQVAQNYDVAVEVLNARRLVKGYSDTHARGESKFDRVIGAVPLLTPRADGAEWMRRLRDAALLDENGIALDGALKTISTL